MTAKQRCASFSHLNVCYQTEIKKAIPSKTGWLLVCNELFSLIFAVHQYPFNSYTLVLIIQQHYQVLADGQSLA